MAKAQSTAQNYFPRRHTLRSLAEAAQLCQACPLYKTGTQTVFGEGIGNARILMVGEQPGNDEDLQGRPFVGPAGKILNKALSAAGIDRSEVYLTNAVKHFKWQAAGKRRLHKKPNGKEVAACLPWLEAEIELVKPEVLVVLGATAAQALLGKDFRVTQHRGEIIQSEWSEKTIATIHPSSILRQISSEDRHREMEAFVSDLVLARSLSGLSA
jgi:uracil-DNA glycosylase